MLNNKGFAISSILYLLLVAFLMYLMITLAQFSSSTSIIGKANDDIINGAKFEVMQVKTNNECSDGVWYNDSDTLVRIKSRYGAMYWPKDFYEYSKETGKIGNAIQEETKDSKSFAVNKNIGVLCSKDKITWESCTDFDLSKYNEKPDNLCDGVEIENVCFLLEELEQLKEKVYEIKKKLTKSSIDDTKNPFLYGTTDLNDIYGAASTNFNNTFARTIVENYYALPEYNKMGVKFYLKLGDQEAENFISLCDGVNNKMYIDLQRIINYELSYHIAKKNCIVNRGELSYGFGETKAKNDILINKYSSESFIANTYPILYTDDETFGYIPTEKKIYVVKEDNVISMNLDEIDNYIEEAKKSNLKVENTYFYIKVFDKINSGPNENENDNTIIKGLYNICE